MNVSGYFTSKSVFDQQGCRALTLALARLSCNDFADNQLIKFRAVFHHMVKNIQGYTLVLGATARLLTMP